MVDLYAITSEVYYDTFNRCYKNIMVIDKYSWFLKILKYNYSKNIF